MNSGNSCKNLCVRVRVCVCAQQNVSSVRGEGSGAEKRGENWKCSPHHSGSVLLFDPGAELGAGEGPCVGTRDTATCGSCSGRRLLLARCRRLSPAVVTHHGHRITCRTLSPSTGWGLGELLDGECFPQGPPVFLLLVAFPAALGSVCPQVLPFLPRALLPLAAPGPCLGRCRGLSPLYHAGYSRSRWKFLLFLFPGNLSGFKGCTVDDASAVTTATSRLQLRRELRGIFQLCSEAFSSSALSEPIN